jgi:hypothetical protein
MMFRRFVALALVTALLPLTACTSMKTIPASSPGAPTYGPLKAGDTVRVQTADGQTKRFIVQQIDGETIIGPEGQRYTRTEVVRLERKSFSGPKTACLTAGIVFGGLYLLAAILVAANGLFPGSWEIPD